MANMCLVCTSHTSPTWRLCNPALKYAARQPTGIHHIAALSAVYHTLDTDLYRAAGNLSLALHSRGKVYLGQSCKSRLVGSGSISTMGPLFRAVLGQSVVAMVIVLLQHLFTGAAGCTDPSVRLTAKFHYANFTSLRPNASQEESGPGNRLTCLCDTKQTRRNWLGPDGTKLVLTGENSEAVVRQKRPTTGASLLLQGPINCSHAGVYSCKLDNGGVQYLIEPAGEDCSPKEVTVMGGPSEPVARGDTVALTCLAQSPTPGPLTYSWRVNGEEASAGADTLQLTVTRDSTVTCSASNDVGRASASVRIAVQDGSNSTALQPTRAPRPPTPSPHPLPTLSPPPSPSTHSPSPPPPPPSTHSPSPSTHSPSTPPPSPSTHSPSTPPPSPSTHSPSPPPPPPFTTSTSEQQIPETTPAFRHFTTSVTMAIDGLISSEAFKLKTSKADRLLSGTSTLTTGLAPQTSSTETGVLLTSVSNKTLLTTSALVSALNTEAVNKAYTTEGTLPTSSRLHTSQPVTQRTSHQHRATPSHPTPSHSQITGTEDLSVSRGFYPSPSSPPVPSNTTETQAVSLDFMMAIIFAVAIATLLILITVTALCAVFLRCKTRRVKSATKSSAFEWWLEPPQKVNGMGLEGMQTGKEQDLDRTITSPEQEMNGGRVSSTTVSNDGTSPTTPSQTFSSEGESVARRPVITPTNTFIHRQE